MDPEAQIFLIRACRVVEHGTQLSPFSFEQFDDEGPFVFGEFDGILHTLLEEMGGGGNKTLKSAEGPPVGALTLARGEVMDTRPKCWIVCMPVWGSGLRLIRGTS